MDGDQMHGSLTASQGQSSLDQRTRRCSPMPEVPDHVRQMLDDLRQEVTGHWGPMQDAVAMMNMIETKYGLPRTDLLELVGGLDPAVLTQLVDSVPTEGSTSNRAPARAASGGFRGVAIRPDQFL